MVVNASGRPNSDVNLVMRCLEIITPVLVLIAGGVTIIAIRMAENWQYRAMLEGARWVTTIVGGEVGLRLGRPLGCECGTVGGLGGSMLGWRVCSSLFGSAKRSNSLLIGCWQIVKSCELFIPI